MLLFCLAAGVTASASAQTQHAAPQLPPGNPTDTLHVSTRIVLTDVTVTNSSGNPVRGLKRSDFRIFDDNHLQTLASFTEHTGKSTVPPPAATTPAGTFSNGFLAHAPSTANVILIDTTNMAIVDQMYLFKELNQFVQTLASNQPIAVFNRSGNVTLLLQNFTASHDLLIKAIRQAVPQIIEPGAQYTTDYGTLLQIASYLNQVPGRKNVLWLSGGSNLALYSNPSLAPPLRPLYDLLEKERIAIYPIDVRGLIVHPSMDLGIQQMLMYRDAHATGGHASFNSNGIAGIASHIVDTDRSYYTLTYSPDDLHQNGSWHHVSVELGGNGFHLSYRRGYFDDGSINTSLPDSVRTVLNADGSTKQSMLHQRSSPIIFQATVLPTSLRPAPATSSFRIAPIRPKHGMTAYSVHYVLPAADIRPKDFQGNNGIDDIGAAIVAFDRFGTPVGRVQDKMVFSVNQDRLRIDPAANLNFYQQINLPKGQDFLYIVVWDMTTHRFGTIDIPLDVKKQPKK